MPTSAGSGLDLSARIIVQDEFSNTVNEFRRQMKAAEGDAKSLGEVIRGSRGVPDDDDDFEKKLKRYQAQMKGMAIGTANLLPKGLAEEMLKTADGAMQARVAMEELENSSSFTQDFVLTQQVDEFRRQLQAALKDVSNLQNALTQGSVNATLEDQIRSAFGDAENNIKRMLLSLTGKVPKQELLGKWDEAKASLDKNRTDALAAGTWGMREQIQLRELQQEWARYAERVNATFGITRTQIFTNMLRTAASVLALYWAFRRGIQAVSEFARVTYQLINIGAQADTISQSFMNLASATGMSSQQMLNDMQRVSYGAQSQTDLMRIANRSLLAGGAQLGSELPRLFSIARAAAQSTGTDINYVYETLIKGIIRASPRLIDNADIYLSIERAVEQYASSIGTTVDQLSVAQRQQAVLNAVLSQGSAFLQMTGTDAETAADRVASLGSAWKDLVDTFGKEIEYIGGSRAIKALAEGLRPEEYYMQELNLRLTVQDMPEGDIKKQAEKYLYTFQQNMPSFMAGMGGVQVMNEEQLLKATRERVKAEQEIYKLREQQQALDKPPPQAGTSWAYQAKVFENQGKDTAMSFIDAMQQARSATKALFADANDFRPLVETIKEANQEAVSLAKSLEDAGYGTGMDNLKDITDEIRDAVYKAGDNPIAQQWAIEAVLADWEELNDKLGESKRLMEQFKEEQQEAAREWRTDKAKGYDELSDKLRLLNQQLPAFVGALSMAESGLRRTGIAASEAQDKLSGLADGLMEIYRMIGGTVSGDEIGEALSGGAQNLLSGFLSVTDKLPKDQWRDMTETALYGLAQLGTEMTKLGVDPIEFQYQLAKYGASYDELFSGLKEKASSTSKDVKSDLEKMFGSASGLQSMVEGALKMGLEPTEKDFLQTKAGTYADKPLENARRFAALAARGIDELKRHKDWAQILAIPPEVMDNNDKLKAWAAERQEAVENLTDPGAINWGAFVENFKKMQEDKIKQGLVIDMGVDLLSEQGLLSGSPEEKRAAVAKALGLEVPDTTLESLFEGVDKKIKGKDFSLTMWEKMMADSKARAAEFETVGKNVGESVLAGMMVKMQQQGEGWLVELLFPGIMAKLRKEGIGGYKPKDEP